MYTLGALKRFLFCPFAFLALLPGVHASQARLVSVSVIDESHIVLHIEEGRVSFLDDASGPTAYSGHYHEPRLNILERFGALAAGPAQTAASWTLTSGQDAAYGLSGASPVQVFRKTKMNGMAELAWSAPWDYDYEFTLEHFLYLRLPTPMQQGAGYTLAIPAAANIDTASVPVTYDIFQSRSEAIKVNLVGYRADDSIKSADVFVWMGDGGHRDYSGMVGNKVYLYDVNNGAQHEVGALALWHPGGLEGDQGHNFAKSPVWIADFTGWDTPGTYRLAIEGIGASQDFQIASGIYLEPFRVSTLGFFYMRVGQDSPDMDPVPRRPLLMPGENGFKVYETTLHPWHPLWRTPLNPDMSPRYPNDPNRKYSDPWDEPDHFALFSTGVEHPNAWGGHSDALDWDRHLAHVSIIYDLLLPYILSGGALDNDDLGIAESGNGIPDVIDEARYEVDFFLRIRTSDGGYSHGLSDPGGGDKIQGYTNGRAYLAAPTGLAAWANAANAAMLAEAFRIAGDPARMAHYRDQAVEAFNHANNLPPADQMLDVMQEIGEGGMRGRDFKHMAAAFLYNVTGDTAWETIMEAESVVRTDNSQQLIMPYQNESTARNQLYGTVAYLFTPQPVNFPSLRDNMRTAVVSQAFSEEVRWQNERPSRRSIDSWSGYFVTVQNVHRSIVAHAVTEDPAQKAALLDALVLEADWGLGRNALNMIQMTTATTNLADRRSVTDMYTSGRNDGTPGLHPGHTPYMNMDDWGAGMVMGTPSIYFEMGYPNSSSHGNPNIGGSQWKSLWPRGELFYNTRFSWTHSEHTPQQTMRGKQALYGYLYALDRNVFEGEQYTLTLQAENGSVQRSPSQTLYNEGSTVSLSATGNNGFVFSEWQGDLSGSDNPVTLTMDSDKTVTAVFVAAPVYALTVINGSGSGSFSEGFVTPVTASAPSAGWIFAGWTGDVAHLADASAASTTVNMPGEAISMTASYTALPPPPNNIIIYTDALSEVNGIWGAGFTELQEGGFEGQRHYRWQYDIVGWWAGIGLNLDNWGDTPAFDIREHEFLRIAVNGPANAAHQFRVRLMSRNDAEGPWVQIPQTQPYAQVSIPLGNLMGGTLDPSQIRELQFSLTGVETGSGTLYFDEIVFLGPQLVLSEFEQWRLDNLVPTDTVMVDGTAFSAESLFIMGATREPGGNWRDILRIESITPNGNALPHLTYPTADGRSYSVWWNDDLTNPNGWQNADVEAPSGNLILYRIQVEKTPQP